MEVYLTNGRLNSYACGYYYGFEYFAGIATIEHFTSEVLSRLIIDLKPPSRVARRFFSIGFLEAFIERKEMLHVTFSTQALRLESAITLLKEIGQMNTKVNDITTEKNLIDELMEDALKETRDPFVKSEEIVRKKSTFCIRKIGERQGQKGMQWAILVQVNPNHAEDLKPNERNVGIITLSKGFKTRDRHIEKLASVLQDLEENGQEVAIHSATITVVKFAGKDNKFYNITGGANECHCGEMHDEDWKLVKQAHETPEEIPTDEGFDPFLDSDDLP